MIESLESGLYHVRGKTEALACESAWNFIQTSKQMDHGKLSPPKGRSVSFSDLRSTPELLADLRRPQHS